MLKVEVKVNQTWYLKQKYIDSSLGWTNVLGKTFTSLKEAQIEAAYLEDYSATYAPLEENLKVDLRIVDGNNAVWTKQVINH